MSERMSKIDLVGTVPIEVRVDLETKRIVRVVIVDEIEVDFDGAYWVDSPILHEEASPATREMAEELVEDADWPAWQVGY